MTAEQAAAPRRAIEVAAGLVFSKSKVLVARRLEGKNQGGLWEFPGGKREPGESWEECLRRELLEELDIKVEVGRLVAESVHEYSEQTVHLRFFAARWVGGTPRPLGCQAWAWAATEDLPNYSFPAADREVLAALRFAPELRRD